MTDLRVGGLTPFSTLDYPEQLAAVVFCQGCPWRCRYCHNPHLLEPRGPRELAWDSVLEFLRRRRGLLDAVVFSGGEPTLQAGLQRAIAEVRELGYAIGLHTAGIYPRRLQALLPVIDWVGLDLKAPGSGYSVVTQVPGSAERAWESLRMVIDSGCAYEVRTTVDATLLTQQSLRSLAAHLARLGVRRYVVQEARDSGGRGAPAHPNALYEELRQLFAEFEVRAA
jgi:pyruvate formate lyase activating enzyme